MLLSADTGRDAAALATPENSHTRSEHIALLHGRRDVKRWWSADTLGIQRGPRLTDCRSDVAASSLWTVGLGARLEVTVDFRDWRLD